MPQHNFNGTANVPHDRTDEFATLPRGQRAAAIKTARVARARAAAAEILRATLQHWPPVNVAKRDAVTRVTGASVAHNRVGTNG